MRLGAVVLFTIEFAIVSSDEKEHVHFKIHVPEIINHHIHTRTIFIHVDEPKKKKIPKKTEHLESYYDDWSHYSSYNNANEYNYSNDDEYGPGEEDENSSAGQNKGGYRAHGQYLVHQDRNRHVTPYVPKNRSKLPSLTYENPPESYRESALPENPGDRANELDGHPVPVKSVFANGIVGYAYPPQYNVHENVIENSPEDNSHESYADSYEEGHRNGQLVETGHSYANDLEQFYDDKHSESGESREQGENEEHSAYRYLGNDYITRRRAG